MIFINDFYKMFYKNFQKGEYNDLEEFSGIEMFGWLNKEQLDLVNSLLKPGKL